MKKRMASLAPETVTKDPTSVLLQSQKKRRESNWRNNGWKSPKFGERHKPANLKKSWANPKQDQPKEIHARTLPKTKDKTQDSGGFLTRNHRDQQEEAQHFSWAERTDNDKFCIWWNCLSGMKRIIPRNPANPPGTGTGKWVQRGQRLWDTQKSIAFLSTSYRLGENICNT